MDSPWRIVRDFTGSQLVNMFYVCPLCWPVHQATYERNFGRDKRTTVTHVQPSRLHPEQDECHCCGAQPVKAA